MVRSTTDVDRIKRTAGSVHCSVCEEDMELHNEGTHEPLLFGDRIEYRQYRCPDCGQGVRFERDGPEDEWTQAAI